MEATIIATIVYYLTGEHPRPSPTFLVLMQFSDSA